MRIEEGDFGQTFAILSDGTKIRLHERRGRLELTAYDGALVLYPTSSNVVEVTAISHFAEAADRG